jgi:hypothetical protein
METWQLVLLIKPLGVFLFFVAIVAPIEWLILKLLPEGKFKNLLRKKIS